MTVWAPPARPAPSVAMTDTEIIDLAAGPGGWSEGLKLLGLAETLGVDISADACATAAAAGHARMQADMALLEPRDYEGAGLLIGSPPCWAWSTGGLKKARGDREIVLDLINDLAAGRDTRAQAAPRCGDPTSLLVAEVLRWIMLAWPKRVALEQVPAVLEVWEEMADHLKGFGYQVWTGIVEAADYGVPQTRSRAILLASQHHQPERPQATHSRTTSLMTPKWISMSEAAGWDGEWMVGFPRRNDRDDGLDYRARDRRPSSMPAFTITEKARSWDRVRVDGTESTRITIEEAAIFQTFRPDYPFQGSRTSQFLQCADAVPPQLAATLLAEVLR